MKLPSFQFYPGDWMRDSVSGCSLASQGLWLRMMFLMHDSERYGYLSSNGRPVPSESIARRCGCTPEEYLSLYAELERAGVPGKSSDGVIFSRRMVQDASKRKSNTDRQKKGRSSECRASVAPLSQTAIEDEGEVEKISPVLTAISFQSAWNEWMKYRRSKNKPISDMAAAKQRRKCHEMGLERSLAAIKHSIANDYQGLFEPNNVSFGTKKAPSRSTYENFQDGERKR